MTRRKQTIEKELKKVNSQLFKMQEQANHSFLYRRKQKERIAELRGESFALAWTITKVGTYATRPCPHRRN
jgi:hypothetical protein